MYTAADAALVQELESTSYTFRKMSRGEYVATKGETEFRFKCVDELMESMSEDDYHKFVEEWKIFQLRPEYYLGTTVESDSMADNQDCFERNLVACAFARARRQNPGIDDDKVWRSIDRCLDWIRSTDFYRCPASTVYHDSVPGGLVKHTIQVVRRIVQLIDSDAFEGVHLEDAVLVALLHDWCKIGLYEEYLRNVKNEQTGQWEKVPSYRYKEDRAICMGHGSSSLYLAQRFFRLSLEESYAIRWHMGRWACSDFEVNELQQANRNYPLVHLLQFADQLAIVKY